MDQYNTDFFSPVTHKYLNQYCLRRELPSSLCIWQSLSTLEVNSVWAFHHVSMSIKLLQKQLAYTATLLNRQSTYTRWCILDKPQQNTALLTLSWEIPCHKYHPDTSPKYGTPKGLTEPTSSCRKIFFLVLCFLCQQGRLEEPSPQKISQEKWHRPQSKRTCAKHFTHLHSGETKWKQQVPAAVKNILF